jgi:hypothetical protein
VHRRLGRPRNGGDIERARFNSLVLVNSAGIRFTAVPRGDMFLCSEDDLLKLLFARPGAADWLKRWRYAGARGHL